MRSGRAADVRIGNDPKALVAEVRKGGRGARVAIEATSAAPEALNWRSRSSLSRPRQVVSVTHDPTTRTVHPPAAGRSTKT